MSENEPGGAAATTGWSPTNLDIRTVLPVVATVAVAFVPVLLSVVKIVSFARGDRLVMAAITSTLNTRAVIADSLIDIVPLAMFLGGAWLVTGYRYPFSWSKRPPSSRGEAAGHMIAVVTGGLLLLLGALFVPWVYVLAFAVLSCVAALTDYRRNRSARSAVRESVQFFRSWIAFFVAVVAVLPILLGRGAWLPTEIVTIAGEPPRVGYVLDNSAGFATVLFQRGPGQSVVRVPSVRLSDRQLCRVEERESNKSIGAILGEVDAPICP